VAEGQALQTLGCCTRHEAVFAVHWILSRDLIALDRKQCRLVTGLLTGQCMLRWHQHSTAWTSQKAPCAGRGILIPYTLCPVLAGHRLEIFGSAWLEPRDIKRASIRSVLALAVNSGLFEGPLTTSEVHNGPSNHLIAWGN
jgi:hypothetical protein